MGTKNCIFYVMNLLKFKVYYLSNNWVKIVAVITYIPNLNFAISDVSRKPQKGCFMLFECYKTL